jgi:hypothetical protein
MRAFVITVFTMFLLISCGSNADSPVITYRVESASQQQVAYMQIDANGYVVRTIKGETDEFQLGQSDFALVLEQIRAADLSTMRLPDTTTSTKSAFFHTILSGPHQISFAEQAVPESVKPLLVSFERILRVDIGAAP